jgi:mRNA interferase MazF
MVDLGQTTEVKGHEQAMHRPCIVINSFTALKMAIVLPVTSSTKLNFYTIVYLPLGTGNLTKDSFVLCHQIRAISFDRITSKIAKLDNRNFLKIQAVLSDTLGL